MMRKTWKMIETLAHWYSSESTRAIQWIPTLQNLNEFQKNLCILVLWTKVTSPFEGLKKEWKNWSASPLSLNIKSGLGRFMSSLLLPHRSVDKHNTRRLWNPYPLIWFFPCQGAFVVPDNLRNTSNTMRQDMRGMCATDCTQGQKVKWWMMSR